VVIEKHFGGLQGLRVLSDSGSSASGANSASLVSYARDSMLCFYSSSGDILSCHTAAHRGTITALSDIQHFPRPLTASTSSSGSSSGGNTLFLSSGADNIVKIWDMKRMKCLSELSQFQHSSSSAAGAVGVLQKLAWCRGGFIAGSNTGQLRYFTPLLAGAEEPYVGSAGAGKEYHMVDLPSFSPSSASSGNSTLNTSAACTDIVSNSHLVACASRNGKILCWKF
jgi:WD40 repeat protein